MHIFKNCELFQYGSIPSGHWFSSLLYGTRLPLGQRGARHRFCLKLMLWTADLLLALVWDETVSGTVRSNTKVLLLTVQEAVLSHTKLRSISSVGLSLRRELCVRDGLSKHSPWFGGHHGLILEFCKRKQQSVNKFFWKLKWDWKWSN